MSKVISSAQLPRVIVFLFQVSMERCIQRSEKNMLFTMLLSPFSTLGTYVWLDIPVAVKDVGLQMELIVYCHATLWTLAVVDVPPDVPMEGPLSRKPSQAIGTLVLLCCEREILITITC